VLNELTYKVRWEEGLGKGPVGEYLEVVDYDPTTASWYAPVDLNDPYLLAQDGLSPSESNPKFHQQMVYAVVMTTIANFEQALGRQVIWSPRRMAKEDRSVERTLKSRNPDEQYEEYVQRLRVYPHAFRDANAFYSPHKKALLFGYFAAQPANATTLMPNALVFTCLSHDIVTHETAHAILDGIYSHYTEDSNPDMLAFHDAFADLVALFREEVGRGLTQAAREMEAANVDSSLILFSIWTESIRHMAENGKGNVLFLDGSPEGMQKQMQDLMALQQLNVVQGTPAK
jgi:prepilin-type processing-associated H-X9-DG protein